LTRLQGMSAITPRQARIVLEASKYIGLTEIAENRKWDLLATPGKDPIADELVRVLLGAGWQPGWPYCAAWTEAVWRASYADAPRILRQIAEILTPHCLTSWRNARASGWTSQTPVVGAIGVMQKGDTDQGHQFIIEKVPGNGWLHTLEANTSPNAGTAEADRNGDGIYRKKRVLTLARTPGLHLLGFILPPAV
jgi:hypothetical protein